MTKDLAKAICRDHFHLTIRDENYPSHVRITVYKDKDTGLKKEAVVLIDTELAQALETLIYSED